MHNQQVASDNSEEKQKSVIAKQTLMPWMHYFLVYRGSFMCSKREFKHSSWSRKSFFVFATVLVISLCAVWLAHNVMSQVCTEIPGIPQWPTRTKQGTGESRSSRANTWHWFKIMLGNWNGLQTTSVEKLCETWWVQYHAVGMLLFGRGRGNWSEW